MKKSPSDVYVALLAGLLLFTWAIGFGKMLNSAAAEKERLVEQCMADGHKEYECRR